MNVLTATKPKQSRLKMIFTIDTDNNIGAFTTAEEASATMIAVENLRQPQGTCRIGRDLARGVRHGHLEQPPGREGSERIQKRQGRGHPYLGAYPEARPARGKAKSKASKKSAAKQAKSVGAKANSGKKATSAKSAPKVKRAAKAAARFGPGFFPPVINKCVSSHLLG